MKSIVRLSAQAIFSAGVAGLFGSTALAAPGQDFPNTSCTCMNCGVTGQNVTGQCGTVCKDKEVTTQGSNGYCRASAQEVDGVNPIFHSTTPVRQPDETTPKSE